MNRKHHKPIFNPSVQHQKLEEYEKSNDQEKLILTALKKIPLTRDLSEQVHNELQKIMQPVKFEPEQHIVTQGEAGDRFFVVTSGHCVVIKNERKVNECNPGDGFGDLALLFNQPRAATVKATQPTECFFLTSNHFKSFMMQARQQQIKKYEKLLKSVKILQNLTEQETYMIAQAMRPYQASADTEIIVQGEEGDVFYLIESGDVQVLVNGKQVAVLHQGSYFGEQALLHNSKRNATVKALGVVNCAIVDRDTFTNLIGKLQGLEDGRKNE